MIGLSSESGTLDLGSSAPSGPIAARARAGDVDPMGEVANLVDVMLVLACGLMLAIVTYWQIDLPDVTQIMKQREMTEVSDVEDISDRITEAGSSYNELGTVYEDPETGKMYMIQDDGEGSEGANAEGGNAEAANG